MGPHSIGRVMIFLAILSIVSLVSFGGGVSQVETTTGSVFDGTVLGIAPLLRLDYSAHTSFDIPLSSIEQIVIDFPRVVIETPTRVYIGPYSAFSGVDDVITVQQEGTKRDIPFAALRAIALNGHSFHEVPRTWLKDGYLKLPAVLDLAPAPKQDKSSVPAVTADEKTPAQTWDELYQTPTMPQQEETPWWILLLITAGLGVLVYLSL